MARRGKGYYKDKYGSYLVQITENGKTNHVGYYKTEEEADIAWAKAREGRLRRAVERYGHNLEDGVIYEDDYIVFDNSDIFTTTGWKIRPEIVKGYLRCSIHHHPELVHRLVAKCFIPNPMNKPEVNHIDGNKLNNDVSNLEWVTVSENAKHAFATGLKQPIKGEKNGQAKLSARDVEFIRSHYKPRSSDFNIYTLSKMFNISPQQISRIIRNERWY